MRWLAYTTLKSIQKHCSGQKLLQWILRWSYLHIFVHLCFTEVIWLTSSRFSSISLLLILNFNKTVLLLTILLAFRQTTGYLIVGNLKATALSTVEPVAYLGVIFSNDAKWTTHVEDIFRKFLRLFSLCNETSKVINAKNIGTRAETQSRTYIICLTVPLL